MLWQVIFIIAGILLAFFVAMLLGLRVSPKPLPPYPDATAYLETIPQPEGLPAPVERFYRVLYGDEAPVFESPGLDIANLGQYLWSRKSFTTSM